MTKSCMKLPIWIWLAILAMLPLGASVVFAQKQPAAAQSSFVSWTIPAKDDAGKYAGDKNCLEGECHTSRALQSAKTVHARVDVGGTNAHASCESCHGPGKEHTDREKEADRTKVKDPAAAKLIFKFDRSPEANSAPCLACHRTSKEHDLYGRSEHKLQAVSCVECHTPHLVNPGKQTKPSLAQTSFAELPSRSEESRWLNESLLKKAQPALCITCHRSIEAQFALPVRHRVLEGAMKCSDCHNAHGSLTKPLLKKSAAFETCVACHPDKRGPFVYEHASVKVEGCTVCHTPHGSVTQHLLTRGETRFLCVSCHGGHGNASFQASGQCTRCHVAIHGSNTSQYFVK
jgi:predicted CXXCH cytochrome family protein